MDLERKVAGAVTQDKGETGALLQETLKDLEETRRHILDLEDKTERAGQNVKSIAGRQAALETLQKEQSEKMAAGTAGYADLGRRLKENEEKNELLAARIEESSVQQARLMRKVDKAIEDRIRFMRKIERLEETVIQTRDTLNAKAMVLLTDQGANMAAIEADDDIEAGLAALQSQMRGGTENASGAHEMDSGLSWWRRSYRLRAAGVGMLVAASLVGGWFIGEIQKPQFADSSWHTAALDGSFGDKAAPPVFDDVTESQKNVEPEYAEQYSNIAALDWAVEDKASSDAAETAQTPETQQNEQDGEQASLISRPVNDDIGTLDLSRPEDVEALLLNKTPEEAAIALNTIEPSPPVVSGVSERVEAPVITANLPPVIDPRSMTKPDSALPDVVKPIEKQAFDGVPEAQHDLAAIYTAGHGGVKQDYKRAAFWFEQAATRGVANAAYNLGVLYHQGLGMDPNMDKALFWYTQAAALGHPEAQYNLGIAYIEGIGVNYDPEKAASFFRAAADKDIMEAAYNLGLIYENGLLGEVKPDEALMWYKTAADQGSPEARQALEQLAKSLSIKLEDVNRLVDNMKVIKKSDNAAAPALAPQDYAATPPAVSKPALSKQGMMAQIQEYLQRSGLFPGPSDGVGGPLTEDAIRAYQKRNGLNADGRATPELLTHMLSNTKDAPRPGNG
ncbi:MAG: SEL1-like repeat protein [Alphaproteobacteria bacterium]|nr:SEL1-like repeat protein [Alphaproteobacteria bacterium]